MPGYHLWKVGTRKSKRNYDPMRKGRVGNVGRTLMRLISPLAPKAMDVIIGDLELETSRLVDWSFLAFHEELFCCATKHVIKWLKFNPDCRKRELGTSRALKVFVNAERRISVVNAGEHASPNQACTF
jgi:hypothetical protein